MEGSNSNNVFVPLAMVCEEIYYARGDGASLLPCIPVQRLVGVTLLSFSWRRILPHPSRSTHTSLRVCLTHFLWFIHTSLLANSQIFQGITHSLHKVCRLFTLHLLLHYSRCTQTLLWVLLTVYSMFTNTVLSIFSHFTWGYLALYSGFTRTLLQVYSHFFFECP